MLRKFYIAILFLFVAVVLSWKAFEYRFHLRFVPENMGVWWVRYVAEESWGFGPGGNEAGIIVFDMPEKVQDALNQRGIAWLEALPPNSWGRGNYRDWQPTPIPASKFWPDQKECPPENSDRYLLTYPNGCPSIAGYMGRYGFNIPFDSEVERMINQAIFSDGAYYAYGRTGVLIIIPAKSRIVYVYSG